MRQDGIGHSGGMHTPAPGEGMMATTPLPHGGNGVLVCVGLQAQVGPHGNLVHLF